MSTVRLPAGRQPHRLQPRGVPRQHEEHGGAASGPAARPVQPRQAGPAAQIQTLQLQEQQTGAEATQTNGPQAKIKIVRD